MRAVNSCWSILLVAILLRMFVPAAVLADPPDAAAITLPAAAEPTDREKVRAIDRALKATLTKGISLDVIETPLSDVVKDLAKNLDITIVLDPEGLEESSVTPDQLVSLNLKGLRADAILRILLEPLHLHHAVRDGVLVITSNEKYAEMHMQVRVFDVRGLLATAGTPSKPLPHWQPQPQAYHGANGFFAVEPEAKPADKAAAAPAAPAPPPAFKPNSPADHLVSLVCDVVAPHTWTHRGGTATAKVFGNTLIVRQTDEALDEISDLLEQMRKAERGEKAK